MNIATICVSGVYASAKAYTHIPAGLVGATVSFEFTDPRWDGLLKTAIFQGNVIRDVIMREDIVRLPPETVEKPGGRLLVGVYGVDADKNIVIPTLWTDIGIIRAAADPSGDPSVDPELPVWAQLQDEIEKLKQNTPEDPEVPGQDGEDGGYYTPSLTQPADSTLEFQFTPSKPDMPAVDSVQVELPHYGGNAEDGFSPIATVEQTATGAVISITDKNGTTTATITNGKDGQDYVLTPDDKTEIAEMAAELVDAPEGSGSGIHVGPDAPTDSNVNVWIDTDEEAEEPPAGKDGTDGVGIIDITISEV